MSEGLLHKTGFASQQSLTGNIVMMGMRGTHVDEIHVWVVNQLCIRATSLGYPPLLRKGLSPLQSTATDSIGLTFFKATKSEGSLFGYPSCADDSDMQHYLIYSEKSVNFMSPLRASVSCMAKAAGRL